MCKLLDLAVQSRIGSMESPFWTSRIVSKSVQNVTTYTTAHTGDTQKSYWSFTVAMTHMFSFLFFPRASHLLCSLCGVKRSHVFKFCEHLKASNTMTRFGSWLSNFCYSPQNSTRNELRRSESKTFLGGESPSSMHASHALLRFTKYSIEVHTGTPLFKILHPPLSGHPPQKYYNQQV